MSVHLLASNTRKRAEESKTSWRFRVFTLKISLKKIGGAITAVLFLPPGGMHLERVVDPEATPPKCSPNSWHFRDVKVTVDDVVRLQYSPNVFHKETDSNSKNTYAKPANKILVKRKTTVFLEGRL